MAHLSPLLFVANAVLLAATVTAGAEECRAHSDGTCDAENLNLVQFRRSSAPGSRGNDCPSNECTTDDFIPPGLFSANDGPQTYQMWKLLESNDYASTKEMATKYMHNIGFKSVRLDEAGRAFHLPCMFPVNDTDHIPDPMLEKNWNWEYADAAIKALIDNGIAPVLKIPVYTWQSTRLAGQYYVGADNKTHAKIYASNYAECKPWPTVSGVIMARKNGTLVGTLLAKMIVKRYNNPDNFPVKDKKGGALDRSTFPDAFNAVELMNEWSMQQCFPYGGFPATACPKDGHVDEALWRKYCFGKPYTWSSRYWDSRPEDAWTFYVETAIVLKKEFPHVRVGGPATGTGGVFWPCNNYTGLAQQWVEGFLGKVKETKAPLDFFSFHYYGLGQNQTDKRITGGQITDLNYIYNSFKGSVEKADLTHLEGKLRFVLTENNSPFMPGNKSNVVGSRAGAAASAAKLAQLVAFGDVEGAFIYTGRNGAFEPGNPYSFPLGCHPQWTSNNPSCRPKTGTVEHVETCVKGCTPPSFDLPPPSYEGCGPEDVLVPKARSIPEGANISRYAAEGYWGASCDTTELEDINVSSDLSGCKSPKGDPICQFGPYPNSGMGSLYATDAVNPTGMMYHMMLSAGGSQKLKLVPEVAEALQHDAGVYALGWLSGAGQAMLMMSNPHATSVTYDMPSAAQLLGAKVTGKMWGKVLLQTTWEDDPVSAICGLNSIVPLLGVTEGYTKHYGLLTVHDKLPKLEAFSVIVLKMKFTGCTCRARPVCWDK